MKYVFFIYICKNRFCNNEIIQIVKEIFKIATKKHPKKKIHKPKLTLPKTIKSQYKKSFSYNWNTSYKHFRNTCKKKKAIIPAKPIPKNHYIYQFKGFSIKLNL